MVRSGCASRLPAMATGVVAQILYERPDTLSERDMPARLERWPRADPTKDQLNRFQGHQRLILRSYVCANRSFLRRAAAAGTWAQRRICAAHHPLGATNAATHGAGKGD